MKRLPANTKSFQMQMHRILTCVFANAHKSGFSICLVLAFVLVFEMNPFLHYYLLERWPSSIILIVILIRSECGGIQMPSGIFSHLHSGGHAPVNLSLSHFPSIVKVTLPLKHSQKLQVTFANVTQTSKEIWRHLIANVLFFPFFGNTQLSVIYRSFFAPEWLQWKAWKPAFDICNSLGEMCHYIYILKYW